VRGSVVYSDIARRAERPATNGVTNFTVVNSYTPLEACASFCFSHSCALPPASARFPCASAASTTSTSLRLPALSGASATTRRGSGRPSAGPALKAGAALSCAGSKRLPADARSRRPVAARSEASIARAHARAGWRAAGGEAVMPQAARHAARRRAARAAAGRSRAARRSTGPSRPCCAARRLRASTVETCPPTTCVLALQRRARPAAALRAYAQDGWEGYTAFYYAQGFDSFLGDFSVPDQPQTDPDGQHSPAPPPSPPRPTQRTQCCTCSPACRTSTGALARAGCGRAMTQRARRIPKVDPGGCIAPCPRQRRPVAPAGRHKPQ
jgi:hypothetical protein